ILKASDSATASPPTLLPPTGLAALGAPPSRRAGGFLAPLGGATALGRIRKLSSVGGAKRRYAAAVGLGALALGAAIALLGTSGWLISRASQQPPALYLLVAMTAVRAF